MRESWIKTIWKTLGDFLIAGGQFFWQVVATIVPTAILASVTLSQPLQPTTWTSTEWIRTTSISLPLTFALSIVGITWQLRELTKKIEIIDAGHKPYQEALIQAATHIADIKLSGSALFSRLYSEAKNKLVADFIFSISSRAESMVKPFNDTNVSKFWGELTGIVVEEEDTLVQADILLWRALIPIAKREPRNESIDVFATHFCDPQLWINNYGERLLAQRDFLGVEECKTSLHRFFVKTKEGGFANKFYDLAVEKQKLERSPRTGRSINAYTVKQTDLSPGNYVDFIWIPRFGIAILWLTGKELYVDPKDPPRNYLLVHLPARHRLEDQLIHVLRHCVRNLERRSGDEDDISSLTKLLQQYGVY